jgi:DNA (cytosine-5)-methyltransferase 1
MSNKEVPVIMDSRTLAEEWDVSTADVMDAAEYLRVLGYEIRNHTTNPQIGEDMWLIPYTFPTLTPLSVQLWKKLK